MSTQHTQPEELRLADAMDAVNTNNADSLLVQMAARSSAAELRRLHEVNADLLELLATMPHPEHRSGITHLTDAWYEWDDKRRAAIAKATGGAA